MEKKSLQIGDLVFAILLPLLGIVLGTIGVIATAIHDVKIMWLPLVLLLPAIHALFYGGFNLLFALIKKDIPTKIFNIVNHSIKIVANGVVFFLQLFIILFASVAIAIIGGIGQAVNPDDPNAKEATNAQIEAFTRNFTPFGLLLVILSVVSIIAIVCTAISFKHKKAGIISGEFTRFFYVFGGIAWMALGINLSDTLGLVGTIFTGLGLIVSFLALASLGSAQIAINTERKGHLDFVERILFLGTLFGIAFMMYYPQYLSYGTYQDITFYFNSKLDVLIAILSLVSLACVYVAKYVNPKGFSLFFLTAVAIVIMASNFIVALLCVTKEIKGPMIFMIIAYAFGFISMSGLFVVQLIRFIKSKRMVQGA